MHLLCTRHYSWFLNLYYFTWSSQHIHDNCVITIIPMRLKKCSNLSRTRNQVQITDSLIISNCTYVLLFLGERNIGRTYKVIFLIDFLKKNSCFSYFKYKLIMVIVHILRFKLIFKILIYKYNDQALLDVTGISPHKGC